LTETHFTTTLRFNDDLAARYADDFVRNLNLHFNIYHFGRNDGAWYDRHVDEQVSNAIPTFQMQVKKLKDGRDIKINTASCCTEMSLINRGLESKNENGD